MADIQIPLTIVANTGTGALMKPYRLAGDTAVYKESNPSAQPATLLMRREEPKATKDYAGAQKSTVKFTRQFADVQGRLWPAVFTSSSSLPAFLTDAQKTAFITEAALVNELSESRAAHATQLIPQS